MPTHAGSATPSPTATPAGASDLARLVETELRLEAMLAAVRTDGAHRIAAATDAALARDAALAAELEAAGRGVEVEINAERARRTAEITAAGQRDAARFDRVPPERIAAMARDVVQRLVRDETGT